MTDSNLITDIDGIRVGNVHDTTILSGVTCVVFDRETVASCTTRGGAPGTRDTDLLRPEMSIQGLNAVLLSGGSLFGLDAAGGAVAFLRENAVGHNIGGQIIPIASQAITFDLLNGGDKNWGSEPVYWRLGWQAAAAARKGPFDLGSIGGGFGATTANLKGGLGSASTVIGHGIRVAALVVVNAVGSATIGQGPHFWAAPFEQGDEFGGYGLPAKPITPADLRLLIKGGAPPSTTIALVVTSAQLTKAEIKRVAIMADDGLARAIRPAHAPMDGDTVFAVSTLEHSPAAAGITLTEIGAAAADCLSRAIARGVYHASVPGARYTGPPAFCDVHKR
jgi:L-aminopeptidase/D-esterase-like protein